jgi:hypothetical protein
MSALVAAGGLSDFWWLAWLVLCGIYTSYSLLLLLPLSEDEAFSGQSADGKGQPEGRPLS